MTFELVEVKEIDNIKEFIEHLVNEFRTQLNYNQEFIFEMRELLEHFIQSIIAYTGKYWFALLNNQKIGGVGYQIIENNFYGRFFYVEKNYRDSQYGYLLALHLIKQCKQLGYRFLHASTYSDNKAARKLYSDLGANLVETKTANKFGKQNFQERWELDCSKLNESILIRIKDPHIRIIQFDHSTITIGMNKCTCQGYILAPLQREKNPNIQEIEKEHIKWLTKMTLIKQISVAHRVNAELKLSYLFTSYCSSIPASIASLLPDIAYWLFLVDDIVEENRFCDKSNYLDTLKRTFTTFSMILKGKLIPPENFHDSSFPKYKELCHALSDLHSRLIQMNTNNEKIYVNFDELCQGALLKAENNLKENILNIESFIKLRKRACAAKIILEVCFAILQIKHNQEPQVNAVLPILIDLYNSLIWIFNDIVSLHKKAKSEKSKNCNLILCLFAELQRKNPSGNNLQFAFDIAVETHNRLMIELFRYYQDNSQNTSIKLVIDIITSLISEHIDWATTVTNRYTTHMQHCTMSSTTLHLSDTRESYTSDKRVNQFFMFNTNYLSFFRNHNKTDNNQDKATNPLQSKL